MLETNLFINLDVSFVVVVIVVSFYTSTTALHIHNIYFSVCLSVHLCNSLTTSRNGTYVSTRLLFRRLFIFSNVRPLELVPNGNVCSCLYIKLPTNKRLARAPPITHCRTNCLSSKRFHWLKRLHKPLCCCEHFYKKSLGKEKSYFSLLRRHRRRRLEETLK